MQKNVYILHGMSCHLEDCFGPSLTKELKKLGCNVITPYFTLGQDITLDSWLNEMNKYQINDEDIFICHSLSTNFILKFLAKKRIKCHALIAIAGGYAKEADDKNSGYSYLTPFIPTKQEFDWAIDNINYRYNVYSNNDDIWSLEMIQDYIKFLNAKPVFLKDKGHFGRRSLVKEIPEVVEIVKNII